MGAMDALSLAAFVAGFAVVLGSFVAAHLGRARAHVLQTLSALLGVASIAALVALGVNLVARFADTEPLALAAAGLGGAAIAELAVLAFVRGMNRLADQEELLSRGRERVAAALDAHAEERVRELERTLARERANAGHLLGQQERKLTSERRDMVARQADRARAELAQSIEQIQERLEQRLAAWAADLDRGQRALEARLNALAKRQSETITAYEARLAAWAADLDRGQRALEARLNALAKRQSETITADEARLAADSDYLRTVTEEQQAALGRLRTELERVGREILQEGRAEMEAHGDERRRALVELGTRLREQERELRERVEREEGESLSRITAIFADVERRQRANLERALDRAASRLAEDAERRFDAQIRESREKTAQRLSNELDKAMEQFARRSEKEISERINEAAHAAAGSLERRIADITRAAEAQHEVAAERLNVITRRLNDALAQADRRIAAFETQIESEVEARRESLERSIRAGEA
jgi:hypothetical protein